MVLCSFIPKKPWSMASSLGVIIPNQDPIKSTVTGQWLLSLPLEWNTQDLKLETCWNTQMSSFRLFFHVRKQNHYLTDMSLPFVSIFLDDLYTTPSKSQHWAHCQSCSAILLFTKLTCRSLRIGRTGIAEPVTSDSVGSSAGCRCGSYPFSLLEIGSKKQVETAPCFFGKALQAWAKKIYVSWIMNRHVTKPAKTMSPKLDPQNLGHTRKQDSIYSMSGKLDFSIV